MHKIKYKTQYVVSLLEDLQELDCLIKDDTEDITIKVETKEASIAVLKVIANSNMPLTYQVENGGLLITIFDPRL